MISNNSKGIVFYHSSTNKISFNTISNNKNLGVELSDDSDINRFWSNNFVKNKKNAEDECINNWYKNEVGNYWYDYEENYENALDIDGIWDTPYKIPGGDNEDKYPLVEPVEI